MGPIFRRTLALLCGGLLAACATASLPAPAGSRPSGGRLITAEEIQRSGAYTAWQVLERRPGLLRTGTTAAGRPVARSTRGPNGFTAGELLLVVDGVRTTDLGVLRDIPAESIRSMEILGIVEGTTRYGAGSHNGVIVVRTQPPPLR